MDRCLYLPRVDVIARIRGEEFVDLREACLRGHRFELERSPTEARKLALHHRAALRNRFIELLRLEPLPDLRLRAMAVHVAKIRIQPVARRTPLLRRDDVDLLAVLEHVVERHHLAVDAGAPAAVPEPGVDVIGEVDRRGAARQIDDLA